MKIGTIGMGFVGGTTAKFLGQIHEILPYDKYKEPYKNPSKLKDAEAVFISVPTPMKPSGEIDYSSIHDSLETLIKNTSRDKRPLTIIRSTVIPGTADSLEQQYPFNFVSNPEFLREKNALEDMKNTKRIIIGAKEEEDSQKIEEIYKPLFPDAKYIHVNRKTAEMIKYASNTMLAGQIALANEIYQICQSTGVDYNEVKNTLLIDNRIAKNINVPGPDGDLGFGGKCLPKDLNAIISHSEDMDYEPSLLKSIWKFNEEIRKNKDWLNIKGATSENNYKKNE